MINTYETVCITLDDICEHFGTKTSDYIFTRIPREDNSYVPFDFDDDTYFGLADIIDHVDPDNKCFYNEFALMTYLREILPNRDSCLIYVSF